MKPAFETIYDVAIEFVNSDPNGQEITQAILAGLAEEGWAITARPHPRDHPNVRDLLRQADAWDREAETAVSSDAAERCRAVAASRRDEAERLRGAQNLRGKV